MDILFAAPEKAWNGFLSLLRAELPEHCFESSGRFGFDDLRGYDVLIPAMSEVTDKLLATGDRLKLVQQCGAGLDKVDLKAAARRNILVANIPSGISGNADSVAELGIYMIIGLARDVFSMACNLRNRKIGEPPGRALTGKTIGIVGLGDIGRALIRRLRPFDVRLIGIKQNNPASARKELSLDWTGGPDELNHLLKRSDFVVLCVPLTPTTKNLINQDTLSCMKPDACLINLARGGIVDAKALQDALASRRIFGVGLDVFWDEPPDPDDPIFAYNVIATPHVGGSTDISLKGILKIIAENLRRLQDGRKLLYVKNGGPEKPPIMFNG